MITHKITLPDGTIIEFFNDEAKAMWQKAERLVQQAECIKTKAQKRKKKHRTHHENSARGKYGKANKNHRIFIK